MDRWIEGLPKIDLHCHLDGSLSRETIRLLAEESGVELPQEDAELDRLLRADDNCASLAEYLEKFDLPLACLRGRKQFSLAAQALVRIRRRACALSGVRFDTSCPPEMATPKTR